MVPQLNLIIESSIQLSLELDPMTESNCGTIQLWHHSWTQPLSVQIACERMKMVQRKYIGWYYALNVSLFIMIARLQNKCQRVIQRTHK